MRNARNSSNQKYIDRMDALREPGSTALLCAIPSAGMFAVHGKAFSFAMRNRLGLPALMGLLPASDAEAYAAKQSAVNGRHDAATRAILRVCALSDRITSVEPKRRYMCHRGTTCPVTPDGAVKGIDGAHDVFDVSFAARSCRAKYRASVKRHGFGTPQRRQQWAEANRDRRRQARVEYAAGAIDKPALERVLHQCDINDQDAYHPGYSGPCALAGDRFHPIVLSQHGGWWRWGDRDEHNDFICNISHSGDNAPDYDIEADRFDNHARTWSSWTHTAFLRQAVACAIAVASYGGASYVAKAEMRTARRDHRSEAGDGSSDEEGLIPEPAVAA